MKGTSEITSAIYHCTGMPQSPKGNLRAPSHVPVTDVKAVSRNIMIQKQGMKTQDIMVWVAILPNPD